MKLSKLCCCPVCGKLPKLKRNIFGSTTIQCKPFVGKPHLKVSVKQLDLFNPKSEAIKTWNGAASAMMENNFNERTVG